MIFTGIDGNANVHINRPELWQRHFPWPAPSDNKYHRGHAVIAGGPWQSTGAAKLAAHAALRVGAGLVSVACDTRALPIYAASFQAVMTKLTESTEDFAQLIADDRVKAVLLGPGMGVRETTRERVLAALRLKKPTVLDADALTVFAHHPHQLFEAIQSPCILTPHTGEFARLFDGEGDRVAQAKAAAAKANAVVVLKGFETVIAAPDGSCVVNQNATQFLATAGSGDVLAGICTGLLAQGMQAFDAACAAVWLHAEAASSMGAGLIAEDIAGQLPALLRALHHAQANNCGGCVIP